MSSLLDIQHKIISADQINRQHELSTRAGRMVFTNGCFDILHLGHITYLSQAADRADLLVVGLNSDASVKRLKGTGRPLQNEESRGLVLASLFFVDAVVLFEEDTPLQVIKRLRPDLLVKGGDYRIEQIVGHDVVLASGGKVLTIPFVEGHSSSSVIERMS